MLNRLRITYSDIPYNQCYRIFLMDIKQDSPHSSHHVNNIIFCSSLFLFHRAAFQSHPFQKENVERTCRRAYRKILP